MVLLRYSLHTINPTPFSVCSSVIFTKFRVVQPLQRAELAPSPLPAGWKGFAQSHLQGAEGPGGGGTQDPKHWPAGAPAVLGELAQGTLLCLWPSLLPPPWSLQEEDGHTD